MKQETGHTDRFSQVSQNHSSARTEVLVGITTLITITYILILDPQILADPYVITGGAAMAGEIANGIFIGTRIGAFIGTLLYALHARVPFTQAPRMGLDAFFVYTTMLGMGYTYGQALAVVFISGVFFIVVTAVGLHEVIIRSIPGTVKTAIISGIGSFITIIGLKNAGIVISNPVAPVSLVDSSQWKVEGVDLAFMSSVLAALTRLVVMGTLHARKIKDSIPLDIVATAFIGIPLGVTHISNLDMNIGMKFRDSAEVLFVKMDFVGLFSGVDMVKTILTVTTLAISLSLVDVFDSIGTLLGAAKQSGIIDENDEVIRIGQALMSDVIFMATDAMVGTPTVTTMVESDAGIAVGGRTRLTGLIIVPVFLGATLFVLIVSIVPAVTTAPALIFMGILVSGNIRDVDFSDMSNALPVFCIIVLTPFTCSTVSGVVLGLIIYCLMKLTIGRRQGAKTLALAVPVVFMVRYVFMTLG